MTLDIQTNKKLTEEEERILKEIISLVRVYQKGIVQLNASYEYLSGLRSQFPVKFLGQKGIHQFLDDLCKTNIDNKNKLSLIITKTANDIKKIQDEKKKTSDVDKLKEMNQEINKLDNLLITLRIKNKYENLLLEVTPERERYFYEDLVLFVANCKHESRDLWMHCLSSYDDIETNVEYFKSKLSLDISDDHLKERGFTKITADQRDAYVNSRDELRALKSLSGKIKSLRDSSKKLLDAFESDEVNFRRFADRKTMIGGL